MRRLVAMALVCVMPIGCAGPNVGSNLSRDNAAYSVIPAAEGTKAPLDYRIGPLDTIDVTVFQEPDLTVKGAQVDASGNMAMPLVGSVVAAGHTATELAGEIQHRLGEQYLQHPQVTVAVASSVSQRVTVQGEVVEPGVYEIRGRTTLLDAIARAKGETRVASMRQVLVFRVVNGQRMGAVFDVASIRRGDAKDPELLGSDTVIVGYSQSRGIWRDFLSTAPLLNVFRAY